MESHLHPKLISYTSSRVILFLLTFLLTNLFTKDINKSHSNVIFYQKKEQEYRPGRMRTSILKALCHEK